MALPKSCEDAFQELLSGVESAWDGSASSSQWDCWFFTPDENLRALLVAMRAGDLFHLGPPVTSEAPIQEKVTFSDQGDYHSLTVTIQHPRPLHAEIYTGTGSFCVKKTEESDKMFETLKGYQDKDGKLSCLAPFEDDDGGAYFITVDDHNRIHVRSIYRHLGIRVFSPHWIIKVIVRPNLSVIGYVHLKKVEVQGDQLILKVKYPDDRDDIPAFVSLEKWTNPLVRNHIAIAAQCSHWILVDMMPRNDRHDIDSDACAGSYLESES